MAMREKASEIFEDPEFHEQDFNVTAKERLQVRYSLCLCPHSPKLALSLTLALVVYTRLQRHRQREAAGTVLPLSVS